MRWDVVVLAGPQDTYQPLGADAARTLFVPLGVPGRTDTVASTVPDELARHGLQPPVQAWDLLHACIAAYTADVRIPRRSAYDGWTRDIALHVAVEAPEAWAAAAPHLARILCFLTGDHWSVAAHTAPPGYVRPSSNQSQQVQITARTVSLFSGGLDSYIGAVNLLERSSEQLALVGHHSLGGGPTSTSQSRASDVLHGRYTAARSPFLRFWVSPPKGEHRASEITTRGRSILFLGLGLIVASAVSDGQLVVAENGLISLNVPLTASRSGSLSTRTTHPYLISLMRELLQMLDLPVAIDLPYRFRTKGEMVCDVASEAALQAGVAVTMSCARPGVGRFAPERNPNLHCGYCLPCLIRRAALARAGQDPTHYLVPDLTVPLRGAQQADIRALKMALDRYVAAPPTAADLLRTGPLPASEGSLSEYVSLFRRGLAELQGFIGKQ